MSKTAAGTVERRNSFFLPETTEDDEGEEATARRAVCQHCCLLLFEMETLDLNPPPFASIGRLHSSVCSLSRSPLGRRKASLFQPVIGIDAMLAANETIDGGLDASSWCSAHLSQPQNPANVHIRLILQLSTGTRSQLVGQHSGPRFFAHCPHFKLGTFGNTRTNAEQI